MKAIVVGAGIAGLVAARQLGLAGWSVDVLEQSSRPRAEGYMMDFFGPGVEAASERIGLYPRLAEVAYAVEAAEYVDSEERVTARLDYGRFARLAGGNVLSLLRPDMESAALAALQDVPAGRVRLRYGARVTRVSMTDAGVDVVVEGAPETLLADVLIGADGIHSEVRAQIFGPETGYLRSLGMRAAAFIVTEPELNARFRNRFILTDSIDRTVGLYSLRRDQVAAFFVYRQPPEGHGPAPTPRNRVRTEFSGLSPAVDRLIELCPEHPYDDDVAQVIMPTWQRERAVLVGDASGAVSLLAGQGGSLAIAGAAHLADILGPVSFPDAIAPALARFEQEWQPVVATAQASGRRAASSFLPASRIQRLVRRWIIRGTRLPGLDRLVARQILRSIAK